MSEPSTAIVKAANTTVHGEIVQAQDFMPILAIEEAIDRRNAVVVFAQRCMKAGSDYGIIPGTEKRNEDGTPSSKSNTLLKPGAEKLCTLFGLVPTFEDYQITLDWDKGLFYFAYRCVLARGGKKVAEAIGSCNSRERKYRRPPAKVCPQCGKPAILRSKSPPRDDPNGVPGWFCWSKKGGCGANFAADDPAITTQDGATDPNDAADLINTIQKMAQKRAMVAAVLIATNASEFFTQDVEDMEIIDVEYEVRDPQSPAEQPKRRGRPPKNAAAGNVQPVQDDPADTRPATPDLSNAETFCDTWYKVLEERGWTLDEANALLAGCMKKKNVEDATGFDLHTRQLLINQAGRGDFDAWREGMRKKQQEEREQEAARQQAAQAPEQTKPEPAKSEQKPELHSEDLSDWKTFRELALKEASSRGVSPEDFSRGIGMALRRVNRFEMPDKTSPEWRARVLKNIREKKFNWKLGTFTDTGPTSSAA